MLKHPKLASVSLVTIDIPKYSSSNNLFLHAKAIPNYLFIQSIKKQTYTHKEATCVYLSHLDSEEYTIVKDTVQAAIESLAGSTIPLKCMVPGILITVSQLRTQHHVPCNTLYVNTMNVNLYNGEHDKDNNDSGRVHYTNANGRTTFRGPPSKNKGNYGTAAKRNDKPFNSSCYICGLKGHHAGKYYFLMKIEQCLTYLKNPRAGAKKAAKFRQ